MGVQKYMGNIPCRYPAVMIVRLAIFADVLQVMIKASKTVIMCSSVYVQKVHEHMFETRLVSPYSVTDSTRQSLTDVTTLYTYRRN